MNSTGAVRWALASVVTIILAGLTAPRTSAQVDVRGQILFPDGNIPSEAIRFYLSSDDGRVNEYRYSDSNGRFILERLSSRVSYTIVVDSDGSSYGSTSYSFMPAYEQVVRLTLNPLPRKSGVPPSATVSAASGYKPVPKAASFYDRGMKELEKKHYDAAEGLLRQASEADPKYLAPLNDLGVLLMQKKNYTEAEKVFQQALVADPKSVHALLNLGIARIRLAKYEEAAGPLREALRLEPGLVAAHQNLGAALVETDQFDEGQSELLRAAKSPDADQAMVQFYLGKLYARTGDFDKSIASFNNYLEKAPKAANVNDVRALIARMQDLKAKKR
jgi:tetratricopeptide (TPR) repeat protein